MFKKIILGLLLAVSANATYFGSPVVVKSGGTGQSSYTDGQLLIGNSTGNTLTKSTLTAGSGISITNGAGSITIAATGGGGSVTTVSVVSANGFAGSVANATSTPAITISTSVTGILKGNGTAISAATSGTDYAPATSGSSILKGNGAGGFSNATAGTDYVAATTGSAIQKANGAGGLTAATGGTDYEFPLTISTGLTRSTNTITVNTTQNITKLSNLTSNGYVKTSGGDGTLGVQTVAIPVADGGTGQTSYTDGQLLIGNTSTGGLSKSTLTAGSNITITNGNGTITIASTGGGSGSVYGARFDCGLGTASATTKVLLNFEGAGLYDFGTGNQAAWTLNSPAVIDGARSKFGTQSLFTQGGNVSTTNDAHTQLGSGDFTVDYWLWVNSSATFTNTYGHFGQTSGYGVRSTTSSNLEWFNNNTSILSVAWSASDCPTSAWCHIAYVRNSGTLKVYLNGVNKGSVSDSTNYNSGGATMYVGRRPAGAEDLGGGMQVDEFRISSTAIWTTNFTPPSSATSITNTISYNPDSMISSITGGSSPGLCTVNFTGGKFSAEPLCTANSISSTSGESGVRIIPTPTSSSIGLAARVGGAAANSQVSLMCK